MGALIRSPNFFYLLPDDARYLEGIAADARVAPSTSLVSPRLDLSRQRKKRRRGGVSLPGGQDGRTQAIGLTLDDEGRLYIAGGFTGKVFIYDTSSRKLVRSFDGASGFLNDVTVILAAGDASYH